MVHPENGNIIKIIELSGHEETWRKHKCMSLSKKSQSEKSTYYTVTITLYSGEGKPMKTMQRSAVAGWGGWVQEDERADHSEFF